MERHFIEISDLNTKDLEVFNEMKEVQLIHYFEPEPGIFIAESPKVIERAIVSGFEPMFLLLEDKNFSLEEKHLLEILPDIPIYIGREEILKNITGFKLTRGSLCAMRRKILPNIEECFDNLSRIVVLDNVENPTNTGALIRSAAALGIEGALFTKGGADPLYRRAVRVGMGNIFLMKWTCTKNPDYIDVLHGMGFKCVAMALTDRSVNIDDPSLNNEEKIAVIMGNEGDGLPYETIEKCDYTVKIPMAEGVDSLNVAAAGAIAFWQLGKR